MPRRVKTEQGFSLVEIMVVVAIIGVLVGVAVPNYINWDRKAQLKSEVANLAGNLGRARRFRRIVTHRSVAGSCRSRRRTWDSAPYLRGSAACRPGFLCRRDVGGTLS